MNIKPDKKQANRRTYHSDARAAKKEETRQRILEVLIEKMVTGNLGSASMEEIAAAASVGPATLYRHFPNRDALLDGLSAEFNRRVGGTSYPQTPEEITEIIMHDFAVFDEHSGLVQAFFLSELGRNARSRGRMRRIQAIRESLTEVTDKLEESQQNQVIALIAYLASLQSWVTMTTEFGLSGAQVGKAVAWAIQTLLTSISQDPQHESPAHDEEE